MTAEAPPAPTLTKARIGPVAANPYAWPYDGSRRRRAGRAGLHRLAGRLLRPGRLRRHDGLRHRRSPAPGCPATARDARPRPRDRHARDPHPGGPRPRPVATCPPTSAGARPRSAPRSARRARAGGSSSSGEPGWEIVPEVAPIAGEVIDRQARQGRVLRHQPRPGAPHPRHHPHHPDRHHHRRLRAHDDARGERPRLRVPDPLRLHRRHRPGQPRRRAAHGDHAGRRLRLRRRPPTTSSPPPTPAAATDDRTRDMLTVDAQPYPFTFDPATHRAGGHRHAARLRRARRLRRDARQRRVASCSRSSRRCSRCSPPPARPA